MSLISGFAVGKSRRLSGFNNDGRGSITRVLLIDGRTVLVGDDETVLLAIEGGELGGEVGGVGEEAAICREKFRVENFEKDSGDIVEAMEVILLLRPVFSSGGVGGAVAAVHMLLLRKLLRPEEFDPPEDELVSVPLLLIFRSLLKALKLLGGGLVADAQTVIGSRHI